MTRTNRAVVIYGNDAELHIQMKRFDKGSGTFIDFDMTKTTDLTVELTCSKHATHIPLKYKINDAYHNILDCEIDWRLLHTNNSYGVIVQGYDEYDEHFRFEMLPSELFLVISNTSGLKVTDDYSETSVESITVTGAVGWGISVGDLSQYYTKNETEQYVQGELEDYYDKTETNDLLNEKANSSDLARVATTGSYNDLTNKPTIPAGQIQSDWTQTNTSEVDYIKNKPNLGIYATKQELGNYYDKGETDGLLNNKVDTSTLVNDYYNKNTVDNLLDAKADTSDLNNYYDKTQTDTLLNQKADASDLNNYYNKTQTDTLLNQKADASDLNNYYDKGETDGLLNNKVDTSTLVNDYYNKNTVDNLLDAKADTSDLNNYYDKTQTDNLLNQKANTSDLNNKQDTLVSGTNIKTINNESILGSGNIDIQGGGGENHDNADEATANALFELNERLSEAEINIDIIPTEVQAKIDELEENVEQSLSDLTPKFDEIEEEFKSTALVIEELHETAQPTLVSGANIKTINNESILGSGNITIGCGVQSNWNETDTTSLAYIQNKPTIPASQVNSDWNSNSGVSEILNKPNLATVATSGSYNDLINKPDIPEAEHDYSKDYLTIISLQDNNDIKYFTSNSSLYPKIYFSINNGTTWTSRVPSTQGNLIATLNTGDKVIIKGTNNAYANSSYYSRFTSSKSCNVEGNIMSLIYGDNFEDYTNLSADYTFKKLFNGMNITLAENLILPATILTVRCYNYMFDGCTSLTTAPELPATTLANNCYNYMFDGCTSLTTAPELPATTLANSCYRLMFNGCTSLTTAPELPATTLATSCYEYMFNGCTSLTTAPELPATTLATSCYEYMFKGCTSLNYIKCLATDISASGCITNWVNGVSASGTFVKANENTTWTYGTNGIPATWNAYDEYGSIGSVTSSTTGLKIEVVAALPSPTDPNTIYIIQ